MIRAIFQQLRIRQWTKNLVVFAGVVFSVHFMQMEQLGRAAQGALSFCLLASAVYVLNDLQDIDRDRLHPKKRLRPIPSGRLPIPVASLLLLILAAAGLLIALPLGRNFVIVGAIYFVLNIFYSIILKRMVLLDVMMIALGFVLRAVAGVEALTIKEPISPWLLMCAYFLALFLAVCKRRQERALLASEAEGHRRTLAEYPPELVDQLIPVVTATTVIAYSIYTVSPATVTRFRTDKLVYTVPFVVFGVFRYLYLVYRHRRGESPSEVLLTDAPTLINILLWIVAVLAILVFARSRV